MIANEAFVYSIFKAELGTICVQAQFAREEIERALATHRNARIWFAVQNALVLAGNASKLLWGTRHRRARARLRKELGLHGTASQLKTRSLRDAFEHLDQKVIDWADNSGQHYAHRWVDWGDGSELAPPSAASFGVFGAVHWVVYFPDQEPVSLRIVLGEMEGLAPKLRPI